MAGFAGGNEGEEALPVNRRDRKRQLLLTGEVHGNTPFLPFGAEWQEVTPFERWVHPAMDEQGVIGEQLRLDQVGERYGFPQRVRTPSTTAVIVEGVGPGGGVIVRQEPRGANMARDWYEPSEWGGGILVHPLDETWEPSKAVGGDADLNAEVVSRRQATRLRYYKYTEGR
jgi:hypothetical protein